MSEKSNCFRSCRLGYNSSPVKSKTQKFVFTASLFDAHSIKGTVLVMMVMTIFLKPKTLKTFEQVLVSVSVLTFQEKTVLV